MMYQTTKSRTTKNQLMRICLITIGSRGDVQPFIALSLGLMGRGHDVTLAVQENFQDFVTSYGVNPFPLTGDMEEFLHKPEGRRLIKKGNGIALARYLYKEASKIRFELRKNLMEVSWDKDVVIANLTTAFWMTPITEKLNNRLVLLNLNPPVVPTREFPYLQFDFINTPWFNLLTYRLIRSFIWGLNKRDFYEFRDELGLPKFKESVFKELAKRQILVTHCFSNELISRPKDWPINSQITGYLNLTIDKREKENTEIPDDLIIWVENGEKPIYIGFGSMPIPNEEVLKKAIRDILATTKNRIVFCEGWSHISNLPTCDNLRVVKQVNHDWVFPKCKLAVIHGGIGTIHSALKAGLPLIIASIFADQPIWGKIIEKKGLGLHIPFNKLSSKKLVMAFDKVMTKEIGEKVSTVSDRMNNEDGLETTLNTIEGYKIS